jgi:hypothetical protein
MCLAKRVINNKWGGGDIRLHPDPASLLKHYILPFNAFDKLRRRLLGKKGLEGEKEEEGVSTVCAAKLAFTTRSKLSVNINACLLECILRDEIIFLNITIIYHRNGQHLSNQPL